MLSTPIGRLRLVGIIEGVSFLLLLCVAMPLRKYAGLPEAVKLAGWVHGVLFILLMVAIAAAVRPGHITRRRAGWALVASVVPVGTFVLDPYLKRDEQELTNREPVEVGV